MVALPLTNQPLMVSPPTVPLIATGALNGTGAPAIAAAELGNGGAVNLNPTVAAGAGLTAPAGALPTNVVNLDGRRVAVAKPRSILHSVAAPAPPSDSSTGADITNLVGGLAKAAGVTGSTPTPAASSGGVLGVLSDLFHGSASSTPNANTTAVAPEANAAAMNISENGGTDMAATPTTGALPVPTPAAAPATASGTQTPAKSDDDGPDFFTRLQNNPIAFALMNAGLATLANSGAPGSAARSIGEGALTGLNSVYQSRASARQAAMDAAKAQTDNAHTAAETNLTTAQAAALPQTTAADVALKTGQANALPADTQAKTLEAQAAMARAQRTMKPIPGIGPDGHTEGMYVPSSVDGIPPTFYPGKLTGTGSGSGQSATQYKHDIWLKSHPGDEQGALAYAAGHKTMSDEDIQKYSVTTAENEMRGLPIQPDDTNAWVASRAKQIFGMVKSAGGTSGALPKSNAQQKPATFTTANPATPSSANDLAKLPSGAIFRNPADGKLYRKK